MTKVRTRRLRKKLRLGEFQELGFDVSFALGDGLSEAGIERFWDAFILEAIETNNLAFGGGGNDGFITAWGRGSATDAHRQVVLKWLTSRPEVSSAQAGQLVDAWHI